MSFKLDGSSSRNSVNAGDEFCVLEVLGIIF